MNKASTFCQDSAAVTTRKWQIRLELLTELNMYMQVGQPKQIKWVTIKTTPFYLL